MYMNTYMYTKRYHYFPKSYRTKKTQPLPHHTSKSKILDNNFKVQIFLWFNMFITEFLRFFTASLIYVLIFELI